MLLVATWIGTIAAAVLVAYIAWQLFQYYEVAPDLGGGRRGSVGSCYRCPVDRFSSFCIPLPRTNSSSDGIKRKPSSNHQQKDGQPLKTGTGRC